MCCRRRVFSLRTVRWGGTLLPAGHNRAGDGMACNSNDRRQRRKQRVAVGAAASKTQVPPKARCGCWVPQPDKRRPFQIVLPFQRALQCCSVLFLSHLPHFVLDSKHFCERLPRRIDKAVWSCYVSIDKSVFYGALCTPFHHAAAAAERIKT